MLGFQHVGGRNGSQNIRWNRSSWCARRLCLVECWRVRHKTDPKKVFFAQWLKNPWMNELNWIDLIDWLNEWMNEWRKEGRKEGMNEWMNGQSAWLRRCADTETYSKLVHNMASTMFSLQTTALVWAMNIHSLRTRTPGARCLTRRPGPAMTMKPWNPYGATGTFHDVWCRQDAAVQFEAVEIATWDTKTCKSHQTDQQILLIVRFPGDFWSHKFNRFFFNTNPSVFQGFMNLGDILRFHVNSRWLGDHCKWYPIMQ